MGFRLPPEILCEIISHVELKSDLCNWCLVSRGARDFATPRLYKEIWDASSAKYPTAKRIETLQAFLQLPSERLENVRKFEIKDRYSGAEPVTSYNKMLDAVGACISRTTKLEEFEWNCYLVPLTTVIPPLLQLGRLTSLSIVCPMKRDGYSFVENRALEDQICRFKNLRSFDIQGIWTPNLASARRVARVLINSPNMTSFSISLDELRCEAWERGDENTVTEGDEAFWENEEQDLEITEYFSAICQEFSSPTQDPNTGKLVLIPSENSVPPPPRLLLTKLDLGSCCVLTTDIHLLTDTSVLEHIFVENVANKMFASSSPYSFSSSALSGIAQSAPKLRSVHFDTFDYDCDATGLDLRRDFPALDSFYARDEYEGVVEELAKCGGLDAQAGQWRRLALGNPEDVQISELDDEFETLLFGLILKCVNLTHLRVGLKWKDMPLLLSSLTQLLHMKEIHLTVSATKKSHLQPMHNFPVQDIFRYHSDLQIVSMVKVNHMGLSGRVCWRRRWDGLQRVSKEELELLNRDGFPRTLTD